MSDVVAVSLREFRGEPREMDELQSVLASAPEYSQLVTGAPPGRADAQSTYTILPPNKRYEDKFVFGIYVQGKCVGCIDLIRGYPTPATAMLGLLLVAESFQRRGVGSAAYSLVEDRIRAWGSCTRVQVGVVEANERAIPFWRRLGFRPTGEVRPYQYASVVSRTFIFEKEVPSAA
jgi:RimJ/RimL family protein N-acetyltransferase